MAAKIHVISFQSWAEFKADFSKHLPGWKKSESVLGKYIYRGQREARWGLVSSFDRRFLKADIDGRERESHRWLNMFYEEISKDTVHGYDKEDLRLIALAQHYGLPTRLLDWTRSPYVAAFFAYAGSIIDRPTDGDSDDVAIWAINEPMFNAVVNRKEAEVVPLVDAGNLRMRNQDGLFTILKSDDHSLDGMITRQTNHAATCMVKMILPQEEAYTAVEDLFLMGITHKSILTGYEGISGYILAKVAIEKFK